MRPTTIQGTHLPQPPAPRPHDGDPADRPAGPRTSSSGTSGTNARVIAREASVAPTQGSGERGPREGRATSRPPEALLADLGQWTTASLERAVAGASSVSVLFSGGLDSALLAHLLRKLPAFEGGRGLELATIGLAGSADLAQAASAAEALGLKFHARTITPEQVRAAARSVEETERSQAAHGQLTPPPPQGMRLEVLTGLRLALEAAPTTRVLCGQGADELFLGYAHFLPLRGERLELRYREDLAQLQGTDWPATQRIAAALAKDLRAPYLDPELVRKLAAFPLESRRRGGVPKGLLREVATSLGLPTELAQRRKKALQYGSGIHSVLSRT